MKCDKCNTETQSLAYHTCVMTEKRVREIAREEIRRAPETTRAAFLAHKAATDAAVTRARDEAIEEAALVCDGEDGHVYLPEYWNAMKDMAREIRSLKAKPAQPSAEKPAPPPEPCVWMTAKRRDECLAFEKECNDLRSKIGVSEAAYRDACRTCKDLGDALTDANDALTSTQARLVKAAHDEVALAAAETALNEIEAIARTNYKPGWADTLDNILRRTGRQP